MRWGYGQKFFDVSPHFCAMGHFLGPGRSSMTPINTFFWPIYPKPVELQTSKLYQIVALDILMKKGQYVHGAKFNTLEVESQNVNLLIKILKIVVFGTPPPQDVKNFHFFFGNFSLGSFRNFLDHALLAP